MAITDLIPWKKQRNDVAVRRGEEQDALLDLRQQMDRLWEGFFERPFGLSPFFDAPSTLGDFAPRMDLSENNKEITITAELPGMEADDFQISLDHGVLTIQGEKRAEKEEKDKRFHRVERSYGYFHRAIPLPGEVDQDKIDATYKHGVLKVRLPKTRSAPEKSQRIKINS